MPEKDLISKQLLQRLLIGFGNRLFGLNIVEAELLSNEQARIESRRADLVARVREANGENYILHIEIQNDNRRDMPLRMLRYYSDIALVHLDEKIVQYLLRPLQKGIFLPPALFANAHLLLNKLRFAA